MLDVLRPFFRNGPLNILTAPTHEAYETELSKTGHTFWAVRGKGVKDWNGKYRPLPPNYHLLNSQEPFDRQIPPDVPIDLVLVQNRFGQYQILEPIARMLHVPLVCIEHTLPMPNWPEDYVRSIKTMKGHINIFISEFSRKAWGWGENEADVIHHGVDTAKFTPGNCTRDNALLSVVNDWKNRDLPCGYRYWVEAVHDLPIRVLGATPGLSEPAGSVSELVRNYRQTRIFVNTSQYSPIPTALLEAMACGCAVVSTRTCMIPEIIEDGVSGLLADSPAHMRELCEKLLGDEALCATLGQAAREVVCKKFSPAFFTMKWNEVFMKACEFIPYRRGRYLEG